MGKWQDCAATLTHYWTNGRIYRQKCFWESHHYVLQMSVNDFRPCILGNQVAMWLDWDIMERSAGFLGKNDYDKILTMSQNKGRKKVNRVSTGCQQFLILYIGQSNRNGMQITLNEPLSSLYWQKCWWRYRVRLLQLSAHKASTVLWRLRTPHSNELHCTGPKLSFIQTGFSMCSCIQLHKYACNILQISFFACSCKVII